jgi:hypothetical protein
VPVWLVEDEIVSPIKNKYGAGLLGNGVMENYVFQIDYRRKLLRFLKKD